ncbi:MAG: proline dehydrogenase family protein [Acidimicrobiia bacterium]|nr:proline dehydrogenase family protein [Acidimicrobiia bacterium]
MTSIFGRAVLGVTGNRVMRRVITGTSAGKAVAHRFVAGDHLDDAVAVSQRLNEAGMSVSMDHLGEHVTSAIEARAATDDYLACLDRIASDGLDANISVKLTQLGMVLDDSLAAEHLDELAARATPAGTTVTVDMEESAHTEMTVALYEKAQSTHGNLGIAIQSYLFRTPGDLERLIPLGGHIRLCKGAYAEDDDVAFQEGRRVDSAFDHLTRTLMAAEGVKPAIASHDEDRLRHAIALGKARKNSWEFQMLHGVRTDLRDELVAAGHEMRVYVPYGVAWYPYLTRRMAERPANLTFFLRALAGK